MIDFVFTTDNANETVTITGYKGKNGSVVVPDTIGNWPVVTIRESAFYNCTKLTSITLPNSLTTIEWWAFSGCTSLTSIVIPVHCSIAADAFHGCSDLKITIGTKGGEI